VLFTYDFNFDKSADRNTTVYKNYQSGDQFIADTASPNH